MQIAIVYSNSCPYTTGIHLEQAFREVAKSHEITYYHTREVQGGEADMYFLVDSGYEHPYHGPADRTIFYSIDAYVGGRRSWFEEIGKKSLLTLDCSRMGIEMLSSWGIKAAYLPLGYNRNEMYPEEREIKYDICFTGSRQWDGMRNKILVKAIDNFKTCAPPPGKVYGHNLRNLINESRCFLDISPQETDMQGQRIYEGIGCGANVVTIDRPCIQELDYGAFFKYNTDDLDSLIPAIEQAMETPRKNERPPYSYHDRVLTFFEMIGIDP